MGLARCEGSGSFDAGDHPFFHPLRGAKNDNFTDTKLSRANHTNAVLCGATLPGCELTHAALSGVALCRHNFQCL